MPSRRPRQITVHWSFERCESPPGLPTGETGKDTPAEAVLLQHFYDSHPAATTTKSPDENEELIQLPQVAPSARAPRVFTERHTIDATAPAVYFEGRATFRLCGRSYQAVQRLVVRPTKNYAFVASYLTRQRQRGDQGPPSTCYQVQTVALERPDDLDAEMLDIARRELSDLLKGRRGPHKPHWGVGPPVLKIHTISTASKAVSFARDFERGTIAIEVDLKQVHELNRWDIESARSWVNALQHELPLTPGAKSSLTPQQIVKLRGTLIQASSRLFDHLPIVEPPWPPFGDTEEALSFVRQHIHGDGPYLRAVAGLLTQGRRRPNPVQFANRCLAKLTLLTPRYLRDVIRK